MPRQIVGYLFKDLEFDAEAMRRTRRAVITSTHQATWTPFHREPSNDIVSGPPIKRKIRTIAVNPIPFLAENGLIRIYVAGFGANPETGQIEPVVELEFEDGELTLVYPEDDGTSRAHRLPGNAKPSTESAKLNQ